MTAEAGMHREHTRTCVRADNCATGAMLLHAQADPSSASPSYLASHFQNDILQYIAQPGHTTSGARHALAPMLPCRCHDITVVMVSGYGLPPGHAGRLETLLL